MTSQEFCYWLQGFFELGDAEEITAEQAKVIRDHLQLVFSKETPPAFPNSKDYGEALRRQQGQQIGTGGIRAIPTC